MGRWIIALFGAWVLASSSGAMAAAESEDVRRAREEVEREMQKLVQVPEGSVKVVWTGFDYKGYEVDEAKLDLDGRPLSVEPISDLPKKAERTLYEGQPAAGTHHLHLMLLMHRSDLSLLGGYRVTQFRVNADVPFPAARGLSVPVRVGLHIDPAADDPKKKMVLVTDVKPKMLAAVDDSVPPPPTPAATTTVAATELPPPPIVAAVPLAPPPEAVPDAGPTRVADRSPPPTKVRSPPSGLTSASPHPHPPVAAPPTVSDAGAHEGEVANPIVDAGLPPFDAGPPIIDAGPPAPPVIAAVPAPKVEVTEADNPETMKRIAALIGAMVILGGVIVAARRRSGS